MRLTSVKSKQPPHHLPVAETRERVLDAAERLFAEHGIEAVSIRDITCAAKANLAAINYHFGTKQELVGEIFSRRLTPLNQERLALLDEVERKAGGKPARPEDILEALFRPAVEQSFVCAHGNKAFMQLLGRCLSEPNAAVEHLIHRHFETVFRRFNAALLRALPKLPEQELFWRTSFIGGAMHHALLICGKPSLMLAGMHKRLNAEELIQHLITFAAAGLRVPASH